VAVLPESQFREISHATGGEYHPSGVTWFSDFDGQILMPDSGGEVSRRTFQHELVHRLVESCFPAAPRWLNEGLATFFSTMLVRSDRVIIGRPRYVISAALEGRFHAASGPAAWRSTERGRSLQRVMQGDELVWVVPLDLLPSINQLLAVTEWSTEDAVATTARYAAAWSLVDFFMLGAPDLRSRFERYLEGLRVRGTDARALFANTFEGVALQQRLDAYLIRGKFDLLMSSPDSQVFAAAPVRQVRDMSEEEGHLQLAWLAADTPGDKAREHVQLHLAVAKQHPSTRDAGYLLAAYIRLQTRDLANADHEVQEGLRGARNSAAFLEAHLDILLARKAPIAELRAAAAELQPVATTAGALCSLSVAAMRAGDTAAATDFAERARQLHPRTALMTQCDATSSR
jgi:hypothetical protein